VRSRELNSLLGRRCQLMVHCPACGGTHVHEGTIALARSPGEIQVDGHSYALGQVRAVVTLPEPDGAMIPRRIFDLAFISGLVLAAFSALRFWL
jgi:hypothetical protein